jgi:predicted ATPase with chaperone activity
MVLGAREQRLREVFVPEVNAAEAALVSDVDVIGVTSLVQLVQHLAGIDIIPVTESDGVQPEPITYGADMSDIRGQEHVKRALEVAAAGEELIERRVEGGEVQDFPWGSFVFFSDPDGNRWVVQQVPVRG